MRRLRPRRLRSDITAVVFSGKESDRARFAVEAGPCVPLVEGGESLVSPLTQAGGETPQLTAALYTALTGSPSSEALWLIEAAGGGRLSRCAPSFVEAMASSCEESLRSADEDEARGDADLTSFARHQDQMSAAWLRAGRWPRSVVGLHNRLVRLGQAREAVNGGLDLYVWHGAPVPQFVVRAGEGPYSPAR